MNRLCNNMRAESAVVLLLCLFIRYEVCAKDVKEVLSADGYGTTTEKTNEIFDSFNKSGSVSGTGASRSSGTSTNSISDCCTDLLLPNYIPFATEEEFLKMLPPPPEFSIPPPPPFIATDCSAVYSWQLVRIPIKPNETSTECKGSGDLVKCSRNKIIDSDAGVTAVSSNILSSKKPKEDESQSSKNKRRKGKDKEKMKKEDGEKPNQTCVSDKSNTTAEKEKQACDQSCPAGPPGPPGQIGPRGTDGLPGLVIFANAATMFGVSLEGLLAYRTDVKQLFFRDSLTWRMIRVAKCGDGILDLGEQCDDGNNDIHDDCLACRNHVCGDGVRNNRTEECDGRDFGSQSCSTYKPGMTGSLLCTPSCQISYQRCLHKRYLRR